MALSVITTVAEIMSPSSAVFTCCDIWPQYTVCTHCIDWFKSSLFELWSTVVIQTTHKSIFIGFCLQHSTYPVRNKFRSHIVSSVRCWVVCFLEGHISSVQFSVRCWRFKICPRTCLMARSYWLTPCSGKSPAHDTCPVTGVPVSHKDSLIWCCCCCCCFAVRLLAWSGMACALIVMYLLSFWDSPSLSVAE